MGLKTTNYEVKKTGITLAEAYAIMRDMKINKNSVSVEFAIQKTREKADSLHPLDVIKMSFVWDRQCDPVKKAYELAKGQKIVSIKNKKTGEERQIIQNGVLYGWEDDIVSEG